MQNLTPYNIVVSFCAHVPHHDADCPEPTAITVEPNGQFTYDDDASNGPAISIEIAEGGMETTVGL